jgi:hypothetical protein
MARSPHSGEIHQMGSLRYAVSLDAKGWVVYATSTGRAVIGEVFATEAEATEQAATFNGRLPEHLRVIDNPVAYGATARAPMGAGAVARLYRPPFLP